MNKEEPKKLSSQDYEKYWHSEMDNLALHPRQVYNWIENSILYATKISQKNELDAIPIFWIRLYGILTDIKNYDMPLIKPILYKYIIPLYAAFNEDELIYISYKRHTEGHVFQNAYAIRLDKKKNNIINKKYEELLGKELLLSEIESATKRIYYKYNKNEDSIAKDFSNRILNSLQLCRLELFPKTFLFPKFPQPVEKNKMIQDISISLNEYPSIHWKKFFDKFEDINLFPVGKWDLNNLIAYFCKKYKDYYKLDYTFKFNSTAPSKSYEVFQIRKLSSMLSSDPTILKDYIDWFFTNKIIIKKKRITSMAFMTDTITVNEYKFKYLLTNKNTNIDRSTALPPNYAKVITEFNQSIRTYGELAFVKMCIDNGSATNEKFKEMMSALKIAGMDITLLDKVK